MSKQVVAGLFLVFGRLVAIERMVPQQRNDKISNGGKGCKYSLYDPSVILQDSCTFVVFRLQT